MMKPIKYTVSFKVLLFSQLFFTAAFITLRESLSLYLYNKGLPLHLCYAITTSAVSLFAITSIGWGIFFKYLPSHKTLLKIALLLSIIAFILINFSSYAIKMLAVTLYVVAGSLYSLTISLLVNAHFGENHDRHQGNQAYQLILNIGGFFGILGIALSPIGHYKHLYFASLVMLAGTLLLFLFTANRILYIEKPDYNKWSFPILLTGLTLCSFILITYASFTRYLMILTFIASVLYILKLALTERNRAYLLFLMLIIFCNGVFWLSNAIFNIQFPIFLSQDVNQTFMNIHLSPLFVLVTDPLASILFGGIIYYIFTGHDFNRFAMLSVAQGILFLSIMILTIALWHAHGQVALFWPLLTRTVLLLLNLLLSLHYEHKLLNLSKKLSDKDFLWGC